MRATLFLSSLFVVSLLSTAALAEKPGSLPGQRIQRVTDKVYESKVKARVRADVEARQRSQTRKAARDINLKLDHARRNAVACNELVNGCAKGGGRGSIKGGGAREASLRAEKSRPATVHERRQADKTMQKLMKMSCEKRANGCGDDR